jgi:D-3-phosphoglycerate dehydrogenase
MSKKVLIATEKPFAPAARDRVVSILERAAYAVKVLEKYSDKSALLEAVKKVNALIVRSDKVTPEVMDAAPELPAQATTISTAKKRGNDRLW